MEGTREAILFIGPPFVALGVSKRGSIVPETIASEISRPSGALSPPKGPAL